MQFKVPQFLDIEDKIFGPFTFRQFIYLAGGAGICFVLYRLLGFVIAIIPILIVAGLAGALTFYRPNNKPFINMLESAFRYFSQHKLYIWKKSAAERAAREAEPMVTQMGSGTKTGAQRLDQGKLRDLAWSLDVLDLSKGKKE